MQLDLGKAAGGYAAAFGNCRGRSGQTGGRPYLLGRDGLVYSTVTGLADYAPLVDDTPFNGFRGAPAEMHGSHYFLGDSGLIKFTPGDTHKYKGGVQRGLDLLLTATGAVGFLQSTWTAAYKIVWGYIDSKGFEVLGAPGGRYAVTAGGTAQNVTVKSPIPSEVPAQPKAFYQVYRAPQVNTGVPTEEYQLCFQSKLTATDIADGFIQFIDVTSDALLGAALYTNPSQETAAQENSQCPNAGVLAAWKGYAWAGNTAQRQELEVAMLATPDTLVLTGAGAQVQANTPVANQATYTFAAAGIYDFSGIDNNNVLAIVGCTNAGNNGVHPVVSVNTAARQIVVASATAVNEAAPPAGAKAVCAGVEIATNLGPIFSVRFNAAWAEDIPNGRFAVGATGSPGTDVLTTSQSLIRVINYTSVTHVYAFDESSIDSAPGQILFQLREQGTVDFFSVQAFGHSISGASGGPAIYANKFAPDLNTALFSSATSAINRLHNSKFQQPEAWPQAQFNDLGGGSAALLWVLPMRDSMLVFLEDGAYRVTTADNTNFSFSLLSGDIVLIGTPGLYNDVAYLMTTQGILAISDSGQISPIDGAIRPDLLNYLASFADMALADEAQTAGSFDDVFNAVKARRVHVAASPMTRLVYFAIKGFDTAQQVPQVILVYSIEDGTWSTFESQMTDAATVAATGNANPVPLCPSFNCGGRVYWTSPAADQNGGGGVWTEAPRNVWQPVYRPNTVFGFESPGDRHILDVNTQTGVVRIDPSDGFTPAVGSVVLGNVRAGGAGPVSPLDSPAGGGWLVTAIGAPDGFGLRVLTLAGYLNNPGDTPLGAGGFVFAPSFALTSAKMTLEPYPFLGADANAEKQFSELDAIMASDATADAVAFEFYNERTQANHDSGQTSVKLFSIRTGVPRRQQVCQRLSVIMTHDQPLKWLVIEALSFIVEVTDGVPSA